MDAYHTNKYVDVINDLVHGYNNTIHRGIKAKPATQTRKIFINKNQKNKTMKWRTYIRNIKLVALFVG